MTFPKFENLATATIYKTTVVKKAEVDCHGCTHVIKVAHPEGPGPVSSLFLGKPANVRRTKLEEVPSSLSVFRKIFLLLGWVRADTIPAQVRHVTATKTVATRTSTETACHKSKT